MRNGKKQKVSAEEDTKFITATTRVWRDRVGAIQSSLKRFVVKETGDSGYPREVATLRIGKDRKLTFKGDKALAPTKEETEIIEEELKGIPFPASIPATISGAKAQAAKLKLKGDCDCYVFLTQNGKEVLFIEQRIERDDAAKKDTIPWSFWNDGEWRMMEPDGLLPLWGLEALKPGSWVMIHEGANTAARVRAMLADENSTHPWKEELGEYIHLGWPGGVERPLAVDWSPIKDLKKGRVVLVCDNDPGGISVATTISKILIRKMSAIIFDGRFPSSFDLADDWPKGKDFWKGEKYTGPGFDDCLFPATWATELGEPSGDKGRIPILLRKEFANEWSWVTTPAVFAHERHPDRMLDDKEFNRAISPFSDTSNTAARLIKHLPSMCDAITYDPGKAPGAINVGKQRLLNTFRPSAIKPVKGDAGPWLEFMEHLIPDQGDRIEVFRWCATLIARPEIKMTYGMLLVSETQGVGKGTLGEAILTPLVGKDNTSVPDEQEITDSNFNGWMPHKRLAIVHEIYAGHSVKAYNRLKSVITDDRKRAKIKYVKEYEIDIWVHIFACSNSLRAIKLEDSDRRWLVPRVTEQVRTSAYWRKFNAWLKDGGGLGIIRGWADEWLKKNEPVLKGEHAPSTSRKKEMIEEGRSDSYKLTLDLARGCAMDKKKVVIAIEDIRQWTADKLGMSINDYRIDKAAMLLKALKEGGLLIAVTAEGKNRRFDITSKSGGRKIKSYVAANFEIGPGVDWKDIGIHYREREGLAPF